MGFGAIIKWSTSASGSAILTLSISFLTFVVAAITVVIAGRTLGSQKRSETSQDRVERLQQDTKKIIEDMLEVQRHMNQRDIETRHARARSAVLRLGSMIREICNVSLYIPIDVNKTCAGWHEDITYIPDTCELYKVVNDMFPKLHDILSAYPIGSNPAQSLLNELRTIRERVHELQQGAYEAIDDNEN